MSRHPNPVLIGTFVLGGVALLITAFVAIGSGAFFTHTLRYVAYFDGSITGLQVGAPVRFRGAPIGAVTDIRLELVEATGNVMLPVTFEIKKESMHQVRAQRRNETAEDTAALIRSLIERGVRATLAFESIVTSQLYIQLDFNPEVPIVHHRGLSEYPEFPTAPSPLQVLGETLKRLPLEALVTSLQNVLEGMHSFFESSDLQDTLQSIHELANKASQSLDTLSAQLSPALQGAGDTIGEAQQTLREIQRVMAAVQKAIAQGSPLNYHLLSTAEDISGAAKAIRALAEYMQRHPEALVFGKDKEGRMR